MKKRTILPLCISSILGGIILILSILALIIKENVEYYPILMLILASVLIITSGILTYFLNDRIFGFLNLVSTILGFVGVRYFYTLKINEYMIPFSIVLIIVIALILNLFSVILSIYRLKVNQIVFDNNIFGNYINRTKTSITLTLITIVLLFVIIISLLMNKELMILTILSLIFVLCLLTIGKVLILFFENKIGSLLITTSLVVLLLAPNPKEFSVDNTCILLMLSAYVLEIILVICEFVKPLDSIETKFGPKEYKK